MEKFKEDFQKAIRSLKIADHMTYVTYPLINEKRLLLKIFIEITNSITYCISSILDYEQVNSKPPIELFIENAKKYEISNSQIKKIREILKINQKYKESAMEFVKKNKIVILSDNLQTQTLNILKIKEFLLIAKEFLMKVNIRISN